MEMFSRTKLSKPELSQKTFISKWFRLHVVVDKITARSLEC